MRSMGLGWGRTGFGNMRREYGIPKIIVVNAVDKQNEHFDEVLADARAHYGHHGVFPLRIPINAGAEFRPGAGCDAQ